MLWVRLILHKVYLLIPILLLYYLYIYIFLFMLLIIFIALCSAFKIFHFTEQSGTLFPKIYSLQYENLNWLDILTLSYDTVKLYFLKNKIRTTFFIQRPKLNWAFFIQRLIFYSLGLNKVIWFFITLLFTLSHEITLKQFIINKFLRPNYFEKIIFFENQWYINLWGWLAFSKMDTTLLAKYGKELSLELYNDILKDYSTFITYEQNTRVGWILLNNQHSNKLHLANLDILTSDHVLLFTGHLQAMNFNYYNKPHVLNIFKCKETAGIAISKQDIKLIVNEKVSSDISIKFNVTKQPVTWIDKHLVKSKFLKECDDINTAMLKSFLQLSHKYPDYTFEMYQKHVCMVIFLNKSNSYCIDPYNKSFKLNIIDTYINN